jgi:hypothetical protein
MPKRSQSLGEVTFMRPDESMELREKLRASLYLSHSEER